MNVSEQGPLLAFGEGAGLGELLALRRTDGAVTEIGIQHGNDNLNAVDLGMEGHITGTPPGFILGLLQPFGKPCVILRISGTYLGIEVLDRTGIEDIIQIPFMFQWEMMAAGFANPGEFTVKIGNPQILATIFVGIRTGDGAILVGERTGVSISQFQRIDSRRRSFLLTCSPGITDESLRFLFLLFAP